MADVSANLKDWSTTVASNSPNDNTTIGAGLADNLQQLQATVRQDLANAPTDVASAATTDLGAVASNYVRITGTTTITAFGTVSSGIWKFVRFAGALTLTHNATSLILLTGANRTTVAGDCGIYVSEGSGNWRELAYTHVQGTTATTFTFNGTGGGSTGSLTLTHQKIGQFATLNIPAALATTGTSSTSLASNTAIPAAFRPSTAQYGSGGAIKDNNAATTDTAAWIIGTDGIITLRRNHSGTAWTNSAASSGLSDPITIVYFVG